MKGRSFCLKLNGTFFFSFSGFYLFSNETMEPLASSGKEVKPQKIEFQQKRFFQSLIDTKDCVWCFHVYDSLNLPKMKSLRWYPDSTS